MKPYLMVEDWVSVAGEQQEKTSSLASVQDEEKSLLLLSRLEPRKVYSRILPNMPKRVVSISADGFFACAFLPVRGNHVVELKDKGVPKGRNHINGI